MRRLMFTVMATIVVALMPVVSVLAAGPGVNKDLAAARRATAKYHNEAKALGNGYVSTVECVSSPAGTMGIHYINPGLMSDLEVDPAKPEMLLYVPWGSGFKLVGVEYFVVSGGQPAPVLFGHPMDGPMPGHVPDQPEHYDLHVWLWQMNPDGMFAEFNPRLSCGP